MKTATGMTDFELRNTRKLAFAHISVIPLKKGMTDHCWLNLDSRIRGNDRKESFVIHREERVLQFKTPKKAK